MIAKLYRGRWTIETAFQHLTEDLNSEINTSGYPKAALFGFCVALAAYIMMSVIKSASGSVRGICFVENHLSGYYIASEISRTYKGMMIAIDDEHWKIFRRMNPHELAKVLKELAANVKLSAFRKSPRGRKNHGQSVLAIIICHMFQPLKFSCKDLSKSATLKGMDINP